MPKVDRIMRCFMGNSMMNVDNIESNVINSELVAVVLVVTASAVIIFTFAGHCLVYKAANISSILKK